MRARQHDLLASGFTHTGHTHGLLDGSRERLSAACCRIRPQSARAELMLYCSRSRGVGSALFVARVSLGPGRAALASEEPRIYFFRGTMLRPNAVVQRRLRRCSSACDGRQSCFSDMACLRRRTLSVTITPSWTSIQIPKTILKKCSGGKDSPIFTMSAVFAPCCFRAVLAPR